MKKRYRPYSLFIIILSLTVYSCSYLRETPSYRESEKPAIEHELLGNEEDEKENNEGVSKATSENINELYIAYSSQLGYELNGTEDLDLLEEVVNWLGTPYQYGGVTLAGADCSGFVLSVYKNVYDINLARVTTDMVKNSRKVNKRNLQEGDLVFFRINRVKVSHVGIYLSNNKFAHASSSRGVVIDDITNDYYEKRFAFGGRINKSRLK